MNVSKYKFLPAAVMMAIGLQAQAAYLSIDTGASFFFGQHGASSDFPGAVGSPVFGHIGGTVDSTAVDLQAMASATATSGPNSVTTTVNHAVMVNTFGSSAMVHQFSDVGVTAALNETKTVTIANDVGTGPAYADAWAITVFEIMPEAGESVGDRVNVTVDAYAFHYGSGPFRTETGLAGAYPNNFRVLHNGSVLYDQGSAIIDPGSLVVLDALRFSAQVGDTVTIDSAIWADLDGTSDLAPDFWLASTSMNFEAGVHLSAIPIPAALPLLFSAVLVLAGIGARRPRGVE